MIIDKRVLNFLVIIILSLVTFWWTFFIFHLEFVYDIVISVIVLRIVFSFLLFKDYTLSWSKATQKTFLIKSIVYGTPFLLYAPYFYGEYRFAFMLSELMLYIFCVNFLMYSYYYYCNYSGIKKTKNIVIYGAGKAGLQLKEEFDNSKYKIIYFCDDNKNLQKRSIDNINIVSLEKLQTILKDKKSDLLVIAMPSASKSRTSEIYNELHPYFEEIKILPSLENILRNKNFTMQLKNISVEDLLARNPKDLDIETISNFIKDKKILITGAGVGGHCIAVDPWFIVYAGGDDAKIIKTAREINNYKTEWAIEKIKNLALQFENKNHKKAKIACMGLAFKPDIDDLRESPSIYIVKSLISQSFNILAVEPNIKSHKDFDIINYDKALEEADIVVFLVGHKEFKNLKVKNKEVIDFCGITKL